MRKILTLALALVMLVSLFSTNALALAENNDKKQIENTVTGYLKKCADSVYFYKKQDFSKDTVKNAVSDANSELSKKMAQELPKFSQPQADNGFQIMKSQSIKETDIQAILGNLQLQEDYLSFYGHVYETQKITFSYFNERYVFNQIVVNGDYVAVDVIEYLDYQYSDCKEPSSEIRNFNISLVRDNNKWMIAQVSSDDLFYQSHYNAGFDLESEIQGYDDALLLNKESIQTPSTADYDEALLQNDASDQTQSAAGSIVSPMATSSDITYNKQNAVNYAMTYSSTIDDTKDVPSFKNTNFPWFSSNCINFTNQCVWAGFGGSNLKSDIANYYGMDKTGSYVWWSNNSSSSASWYSCNNFKTYVVNSKTANEKGLICDYHETAYNSDNLYFSATNLIGAVVLGKGYQNGNPVAFGHAAFVNNATGSTRDTVYVTAYSHCYKNKKLSFIFPSSTTDTYRKLYEIIPKSFKGGSSGNRLWADLLNCVLINTQFVKLPVYSTLPCTTLTMTIYNPSGTAVRTFNWSNTSSATAYFSGFNSVGGWRVELAGTNSTGTTKFSYIVRVY